MRVKVLPICVGLGLMIVLLLGSSCPPAGEIVENYGAMCVGKSVVVGPTDNTAPSVKLRISDPVTFKTVELKQGDPDMTMALKGNATALTMALAEDPEGARYLTVVQQSGSEVTCEEDNPSYPAIGETDHLTFPEVPAVVPPQVRSKATKPGDTATTNLCYLEDFGGNPCRKGFHPVGYTIKVYAQAENFHGLVSKTPVVTFVVKP